MDMFDPFRGSPVKEKMDIIAIDFDDVITDDEMGWLRVMKVFENLGYQVIVVTYRSENCFPKDLDFLREKGYKVICTGQKAKRPFCRDLGIVPKIWIDDTPESVLFDYLMNGSFVQNVSHDFKLDMEA